MATVRYAVNGVPHQWADAWFPTPTLSPAGATSVSRFTVGAPGTEQVPSPAPAGSGTLSNNPEWQPPSAVAPDAIWPQLYVNDIRALGPQVRYLPARVAAIVPPAAPIGDLSELGPSHIAMNGRKVGGLRAMFWRRAIPKWQPLNGGQG